MKSKLALFLATLLFFNIIFPSRVFASSVQDQSKPIFGLTADQVVEKYNQLTDQQKTQVLHSLGNTSIFANSLFGNIFNSTFGVLDDAIEKIGDLFFQANGVVYKLGSSALAWISRLIDKVFDNDLNDLNISQPVVNDFYLNTRGLNYIVQPFFTQPNYPSFMPSTSWGNIFPLPRDFSICYCSRPGQINPSLYSFCCLTSNNVNSTYYGLFVDLDSNFVFLGSCSYSTDNFDNNFVLSKSFNSCFDGINEFYPDGTSVWGWSYFNRISSSSNNLFKISFSGDNYSSVLSQVLNDYFTFCPSYFLIENNYITEVLINSSPEEVLITNNTYYNYIYNIPDQTPLKVTNIVSNTSINYDPVENLVQYLPDNYNIEQNFSVVNNYYISSGSAISGSAIDVNLVSPGVIDVRVTNPEDLTQQVTNNISKDIINNNEVNFGDLNFSPSVSVGLNAAKDSVDGIVVATTSSIIASMIGTVPTDWTLLIIMFLAACICVGFGRSIITH